MNELISITPVSPLRQRLIDDMNMRHFSREIRRNYIRDVGRFATFLGRPPDSQTLRSWEQHPFKRVGQPSPPVGCEPVEIALLPLDGGKFLGLGNAKQRPVRRSALEAQQEVPVLVWHITHYRGDDFLARGFKVGKLD